MKHIILGTAGHVDHGKTALIKALTSVDTDRLKEEKERGITIELGFAPLVLAKGQKVGVVDVPGHEKFVKNMVAGAGGIDIVVLVIAADEGVMPQTREHLEICDLLGIRNGLVALTKTDMVDDEWTTLVTDDIRQFLEGTFLEEAPIVPLSSATGDGLEDFLGELQTIVDIVEERRDTGIFRLPVDRVFTMKGFGTVATGSLLGGKVRTGDTVEIVPSKIVAKVRGIQIHNESVEQAETGNRTAINLQGVDKATIQRGDVISNADALVPSTRFDIFLRHLPNARKNLKNRSLLRFHVATSELIARLILPGGGEIEPGAAVYGQVILESPTVALAGDRFVIRSYSPVTTIGGGEILDPLTVKYKKNREAQMEEMKILHHGTDRDRVAVILRRSGLAGITARQLQIRTGTSLKELNAIIDDMLSRKEALLLDKEKRTIVSAPAYQVVQEKIMEASAAYHERNPLREGIHKEELRNTIGTYIDPKLFNSALRSLDNAGKIRIERENVRLAAHQVNLADDLEELKEKIAGRYRTAGLSPPLTKDVIEEAGTQKKAARTVLSLLLNEGRLIKVSEDLYFDGTALAGLREDYRQFLLRTEKASPAGFRELTGLSRKFTIPLMEYFDKSKLTIRVGDHRILREGEKK